MQSINIKSLNLGSKVRICWGFFWRGMLATLSSMLVSMFFGAILGFAIGIAATTVGMQKESITKLAQFAGAGVGTLIGAIFLYLYIRWLLSSQLGKYRLVLVLASEATN